jgi:hypothetical protein
MQASSEAQEKPSRTNPHGANSPAPAPAPETSGSSKDVGTDVKQYYPNARPPKSTDTVEYVHVTYEDAGAINDLFNKVFKKHRSRHHFDWKFWQNPAGPPAGSIARKKKTGRCLATGIGQRRRAWVNGTEQFGACLCEVASDPDERGGGRMWRETMMDFCFTANDTDGIHWAYGGQSTDSAIKVGERWFGYRVILELVPWELRLGTRHSLLHRMGAWGPTLAPKLSPVLDFLYHFRWNRRQFHLRATEINRFSMEFDHLWEKHRDLYPLSFFRDAKTLNWRYVDNPEWKHRIAEARRDGELVGYIVWREWHENGARIATILDFWHGDDNEVILTLLDVARRKAFATGCVSLRFAMIEGRPEYQAFRSFRSSRRSPHEEVDRIICTPIPGSTPMQQDPSVYEELETVLDGKNWFYTQGDSDYRD